MQIVRQSKVYPQTKQIAQEFPEVKRFAGAERKLQAFEHAKRTVLEFSAQGKAKTPLEPGHPVKDIQGKRVEFPVKPEQGSRVCRMRSFFRVGFRCAFRRRMFRAPDDARLPGIEVFELRHSRNCHVVRGNPQDAPAVLLRLGENTRKRAVRKPEPHQVARHLLHKARVDAVRSKEPHEEERGTFPRLPKEPVAHQVEHSGRFGFQGKDFFDYHRFIPRVAEAPPSPLRFAPGAGG